MVKPGLENPSARRGLEASAVNYVLFATYV